MKLVVMFSRLPCILDNTLWRLRVLPEIPPLGKNHHTMLSSVTWKECPTGGQSSIPECSSIVHLDLVAILLAQPTNLEAFWLVLPTRFSSCTRMRPMQGHLVLLQCTAPPWTPQELNHNFLQRLLAFITGCGIPEFWAFAVAPCGIDLLIL